jgi:hypothetical protein
LRRYLDLKQNVGKARKFPSLHNRKEGRAASSKNFAKPPKQTQPGWFSFLVFISENHPGLAVNGGFAALN